MATLADSGSGGIRSVVAESSLSSNTSDPQSFAAAVPHLLTSDRSSPVVCSLIPPPLIRSAIVLRPATLLSLHQLEGIEISTALLIQAGVSPDQRGQQRTHRSRRQMKQRNPPGCPRIAQQITWLLTSHRQDLFAGFSPPTIGRKRTPGPSWLTFIGHRKDSLWSLDLFRCESATLRTYWVLVVMDQYTRGSLGSASMRYRRWGALCRMFNASFEAILDAKYLSSDHDPFIGLGSASQSAGIGDDRDQNRSLCSLAHLLWNGDRHGSTRVFVIRCSGPRAIWKRSCSVQDIFQCASLAY